MVENYIPRHVSESLSSQSRDHASSLMGNARNSFVRGKLLGVREMTAPAATRDLPMTLRTKSRFTVSLMSGNSVHFASKSSRRPAVSTTIYFARSVAPEEYVTCMSGTPFTVSELGENKCL